MGSHVGKLVVEQCPEFKIRASCRNMKKAGVMSETLGGDIEWVKADLLDPKSMSDAIAGCTHVIHVASPVPGDGVVKNDKQMIEMAVTGMKTIL